MKERLKDKLYALIKLRGAASINELNNLTENLGYKISCGERRLRELRNAGKIERVLNDDKVVVAYRDIIQEVKSKEKISLKLEQEGLFNMGQRLYGLG